MINALIVIDVQNDFCPGGALAVPGGDEIVAGINALMADPAEDGNVNPEVRRYVNRLSDLLFVLARAMNDGGKADVLWVPAARKDQ